MQGPTPKHELNAFHTQGGNRPRKVEKAMTTKKQLQANRNNAKFSTGPKTDEGKQRCARNALKHGLRSQHPVIPGEDPAEYQHKLDQLRADIKPMNALEDDLVEQIADTSWRLKRLSRIEAAIERNRIENAADKTSNLLKDDEQIVGDGFTGWAMLDYLGKLGRYEAQLSRRYHRAMNQLTDLRKNREQTGFRTRPMEQRDREEQEWRRSHPQPPPDVIQREAAAAADRAQPSEQSDWAATAPNGMTWDEFDKLPPDQAVEAIRKQLKVVMPELGQPGPQEVQK